MPAFERWLLDAKLEEKEKDRLPKPSKRSKGDNQHESHSDPGLPQYLSLSSDSSQRLTEEIAETGMQSEEATKIISELFRRTKASIKEIASQNLRCANQAPFKTDRIVIEHGSYLVSLLYSRKKWKSPFIVKINSIHYEKLKNRFIQTHKNVVSDLDFAAHKQKTKTQHAFHLLLMVMTLRYSSLSGGQLLDDFRGGGMQGGINEQAFSVLKDAFSKNVMFECFASPFNVTLPYFASAFEEIDWHFGSVGDLADCPGFEDGCCCEANPPFSPGFMEFLAERIDFHLAKANANNLALTFVVIVPAVHEKDVSGDKNMKDRVASAVKRFAGRAHRRMVQSSACRQHIVLPAKEHGYVEGAQHLRPTRYKRSLYDTSVILLQSKKAKEAPLDEDQFQKDIKESFAERHSTERQKRLTAKESEEE
jgi:phosphorylated CTD-interacting factor 1